MTHTVIDHRQPAKGAPITFAWMATWNRWEEWEGSDDVYDTVFSAFPLVVAQYVRDEYNWSAESDPIEEAPDVTFSWRNLKGKWKLFADDEYTGISLRSLAIVQQVP